MIRIDTNYLIDVEPLNYSVLKDCHSTNKNGQHVYKVLGYYSNFANALKAVLQFKTMQELGRKDIGLEEAIEIILKNQKEFDEKLDKLGGI